MRISSSYLRRAGRELICDEAFLAIKKFCDV